jgi:hypothetical protein
VFLHDRERGYRTIAVREAAATGPIETGRAHFTCELGVGKALWVCESFDGTICVCDERGQTAQQ